jgi:hypothetical protein
MKLTEDHRQRLMEALHDDPGGQDHPIWAELGVPPQPPISDEEQWLIYRSMYIENADHAAAFVMTKVWDKTLDGRYVKLWHLTDEQREQLRGWTAQQRRLDEPTDVS